MGVSVQGSAGPRARKTQCFSFESKGRKKASIPVQRQTGRENPLSLRGGSAFLFYSDLH